MKLEECYDAFGGDYQDVKGRLQTDERITRFLVKFLDDTSYEKLCNAFREENYEELFRASHTLKGISQNLSFVRLGESSSNLTELLRAWETVPVDKNRCEQLFLKVTEDYKSVTAAIKDLLNKTNKI